MEDAPTIAVLGLGYVGLPLALAFSHHYPIIAFDTDERHVSALERGEDRTDSMPHLTWKAENLMLTSQADTLSRAQVYIITVPTPVDEENIPDLSLLEKASTLVGQYLKPQDVVIFESTVYPGATEEVCLPKLEAASGLVCGQDFKIGYSPERINPGDPAHALSNVVKVVAGQDSETLAILDNLYSKIIQAGLHRAESIKVAEASKVIENTQRDLNIALMNELALIFDKLDLDTDAVLRAASSKWNFLPFKPGLVGGHCIGVDPYYLTHKAKSVGYSPEVILSGRRINDGMGFYVADKVLSSHPTKAPMVVNILGFTFKENCSDIRNTRVVDIVRKLKEAGAEVHIHDPWVNAKELSAIYGLMLTPWESLPQADAIVLAVAHEEFMDKKSADYSEKLNASGAFFDIKSLFPLDFLAAEGYKTWRL